MKFKRLLFFLLISMASNGHGQQYEAHRINYGVNEGLPSSECYEIIQDQKGYIWFGTDRGVVRYNGYEFKTFTTKEGLNSNVVFYLSEGPDGKIWFYDSENQLSYFFKDTIIQFKHNDILKKTIPKQCISIGISVDKDDNVFFSLGRSDNNKTIQRIDRNGKLSFYDSKSYDLIFIKPNINVSAAYFGYNTAPGLKKVNLLNGNKCIVEGFELKQEITEVVSSKSRFKFYEDQVYFSFYDQLFVINTKNEIEKIGEFKKGIIEIEADREGNVYIGLYNEGMFVLPKGDFNKRYKLISDCSVSGFCMDLNGGMWLSTQDRGIYHIPHKSITQHVLTRNTLVNNISGLQNNIFYSNYEGELFKLDNNEKMILPLNNTSYLRSFIPIDSTKFLTSLISTYKYIYDDEQGVLKLSKGAGLDWLVTDTLVYGISYGKLSLYDRNRLNLIDSTILSNIKLECLTSSFKKNELFFGTSEGLYSYDFKQFQKEFTNYPIYNSRISDMIMNKDVLYAATRGEGLIIHDKNKVPYSLSKKDGLISNELHKLALYRNRLYVLSKEGLSILENDSDELKIVNYSNKNGLLSNEVNDVFERNDTLWIATNKGITKFHLNMLSKNESEYPIYLKSFRVNNIERNKNQDFILDYSENDLEFSFEVVSFNSNGNIKYRYKLDGIDDIWKETVSRELRYPNLPPGSYKLMISYQKPDLTWSSPTTLFKIKIKVPFWEKLSFIILFLTLILLVIYLIILRLIYKAKSKVGIQKKMLDLERRALQAQMNPHFIFNALTSIQSLIAQNKNEHAEEFLVTFSRLVRTALNQSSQTYISVSDEVDMLNNYLKIESLRFESVFEWGIELSKNLNIDELCIPPMMIQPFVENAIEHGIRPLGKKGHISIKISEIKDGFLEIKIDDDGVGREISKKKEIIGRESKGINLVKDRLLLLNNTSKVQIFDKKDKNMANGTLVVLHVPFQRD